MIRRRWTALRVGFALGLAVLAAAGLGTAHGASASHWKDEELQRGYVVFRHNNVELAERSYVPARADIGGKATCDLARGEYDPVQIGVHALTEGVGKVRLEVECDLEARVYRRIDGDVQSLLLGYSNPMPSWIHRACLDESNVIGSIGKGSTGLFWVVFHAKADAAPGVHRGKIRVTCERSEPGTGSTTELDLEVRVRPFVLQRAQIPYWTYFYIMWGPAPLPAFARTDQWIRRLYRDMAEHSHTSVTFYGYPGPVIDLRQVPPPSDPYMTTLLPMTREVGLSSPDIPCISFATELGEPEGSAEGATTLEQKNKGADWLREQCRKEGFPELIRYGFDEPGHPTGHGPRLEDDLRPFREVRMRVCTAMYADAAYGPGDLHAVWAVYGGRITAEMRAEAERLGAQLWTYTCHTWPTQSVRSRYFAGLYTWAHRLKGNTFWHYYAQTAYKYVWMREGDERPMPTVAWETRRDGIDDYRYLQMLEDSIAANPESTVGAEAEDWLASLRERLIGVDPHLIEHTMGPGEPVALAEYDRIKAKAADYIERLGVVPPQPAEVKWLSGLKDEAKLFRGKSMAECMTGLGSPDVSQRRAAAWALYEMGAEAAAATELLAGQLQVDEVRMPALRALEMIGPQAYAAVSEIEKLFSHGDSFVRLGAAFALGGIGAPWKEKWYRDHGAHDRAEREASRMKPLSPSQMKTVAEALRKGFRDDAHRVARAAGEGLVRMGPAARPALQDAIELLDRPHDNWIWDAGDVVRKIISSIGPEARDAVPKLVKIVETKTGSSKRAIDDVLALAHIRESAAAAVGALENYAEKEEKPHARGCAYYALFCIRGENEDLRNMVNVLNQDGGSLRWWLARFLDALGTKASPLAAEAREMVKSEKFAKHKEKLESFLRRVKNGEGPVAFHP